MLSYQSSGILDKVTNSLDNQNNIDVIYLDFAKAFDKVPHSRLLAKIEKGFGMDKRVVT